MPTAPGRFTDAEDLAFIAALKTKTPVQLLAIIVWILLRGHPERLAILARVGA